MNTKNKNSIFENIRTLIYAILIAFFIRTFILQPFTIPSGSMLPNLLVGDYLFVSKYSYGYSRYSLPFSPNIIKDRIFASLPERGDVVVFRLPNDTDVDYIKRVIGLPGDKIQIINGLIYINDEEVSITNYNDNYKYFTQYNKNTLKNEILDGKSHYILDLETESLGDNTGIYRVPNDHYFMMGDNRDNSLDSRFIDQVGYVPFENFVGRAEFLFFSSDKSVPLWKIWNWHKKFRFDRIAKKIN
ncbi:MAG: signal peptidase I [Alphaproteobacteria bacterium]|jgi:signal peptidase I|nr:signal peptidase I [Alphaproteobacteria bacterium]